MFKSVWNLDLDIKFLYSSSIPIFRRKDSAVLNIRMFDAKRAINISGFSNAILNIKYPSGIIKEVECSQVGSGISAYITYEFTDEFSTEVGIYDLILTIKKDDGFISTQKFNVTFFDNIGGSEFAFVGMIQDLQNQVEYLDSIYKNIVLTSSKGIANGTVPLDADGKVPLVHMPLFLEEHINMNVYLKMVHGFMVDKDLNLVYETSNGEPEYVGHPEPTPGQGGLNLTTTVKDSMVSLFYTGRGNAVIQSWSEGTNSINDMKVNGKIINGLSFEIFNIGAHTIYYKDNYGKEYLYNFTVTKEQLRPPNITIKVNDGKITVESDRDLELMKLGKGRQILAWFKTNGNIIQNGYQITEVGDYTLYYRDKFGNEYVKYFTVTKDMLAPVIDSRPLVIDVSGNGWQTGNDRMPVGVIPFNTSIKTQDGNYAKEELDYFIRPDGKIIKDVTDWNSGYLITKNGNYTWKAYNKAGVETTKTITVNNIGREVKLSSLNEGDIFYLFRNECRIFEKNSDKILINLGTGEGSTFASKGTQGFDSNLLPQSLVRLRLENVSLIDYEKQESNILIGKWNYQYGTLSPNKKVVLDSPPKYYEGKAGILDMEQTLKFIGKGYLRDRQYYLSSTPVKNSLNLIFYIDNIETPRELSIYESMAFSKFYYMKPTTSVWLKGW